MISNMMLLPLLCLLLGWMLPVDSMEVPLRSRLQSADPVFPLDLALDSVDDMYDNCETQMQIKVENTYFPVENTGIFKVVWEHAEQCANEKFIHKDPEDEALTKENIQAICVYTSGIFYNKFNEYVRNNRSIHGSSFQYHSLHFWLTTAVKTLNKNTKCVTTYRRTSVDFTGEINDMMRFGNFASSSKRTDLVHFGTKTCFQIRTCLGGDLKNYSVFKSEEEVLIPPYEQFIITDKKPGTEAGELTDCKVVYFLQTAGVKHYLNCKAASASPAAFSMSPSLLMRFAGVSVNIETRATTVFNL